MGKSTTHAEEVPTNCTRNRPPVGVNHMADICPPMARAVCAVMAVAVVHAADAAATAAEALVEAEVASAFRVRVFPPLLLLLVTARPSCKVWPQIAAVCARVRNLRVASTTVESVHAVSNRGA